MDYCSSLVTNSLISVALPMCLNASLVQGDAERALTAIADAFSPEFQQQGGGFNKSIEEPEHAVRSSILITAWQHLALTV